VLARVAFSIQIQNASTADTSQGAGRNQTVISQAAPRLSTKESDEAEVALALGVEGAADPWFRHRLVRDDDSLRNRKPPPSTSTAETLSLPPGSGADKAPTVASPSPACSSTIISPERMASLNPSLPRGAGPVGFERDLAISMKSSSPESAARSLRRDRPHCGAGVAMACASV